MSRSHRCYRRRAHRQTESGLPASYDLRFASLYTYSPRGESATSERSRQLCARVKSGAVPWLKSYATRLFPEATPSGRFKDFFNARAVLVPIPVCDPSTPSRGWSAKRLAFVLRDIGLGQDIWIGLRRSSSVERSSTAWMWGRPTVLSHYRSFVVAPSPAPPGEILLVDDVVTKGRTLVAAAMRLSVAFPGATIRAFTLVRTMGFVMNVERLFDPCQGRIRWDGRDAYREP